MTTIQTYRLISSKGEREFSGSEREAVREAQIMQEELQAASGVSVEDEDGFVVAEIE